MTREKAREYAKNGRLSGSIIECYTQDDFNDAVKKLNNTGWVKIYESGSLHTFRSIVNSHYYHFHLIFGA